MKHAHTNASTLQYTNSAFCKREESNLLLSDSFFFSLSSSVFIFINFQTSARCTRYLHSRLIYSHPFCICSFRLSLLRFFSAQYFPLENREFKNHHTCASTKIGNLVQNAGINNEYCIIRRKNCPI